MRLHVTITLGTRIPEPKQGTMAARLDPDEADGFLMEIETWEPRKPIKAAESALCRQDWFESEGERWTINLNKLKKATGLELEMKWLPVAIDVVAIADQLGKVRAQWKRPPVEDRRTLRKQVFDARTFHPEVVRLARDAFADEHPTAAIMEPAKAFEESVRKITGIKKPDGHSLCGDAFSNQKGATPKIRVRSNDGEQLGVMYLAMGMVAAVRNRAAHLPGSYADDAETLEALALLSMLFRELNHIIS